MNGLTKFGTEATHHKMGKEVPLSPNSKIYQEHITNKYTVLEEIGRGKFAVVRKCSNNETGQTVAAKFIRKRRKGKSAREDILHEVVMLELALAHPRLVDLLEVYETPSEVILVTEYCAGGELFYECVIEESFKESDVISLVVQIIEGLVYLHDRKIVHLDLKPQNILLTKPFPDGTIKLCDFGFAQLLNSEDDMRKIIGTPDYVAPEVLNYEPITLATDIWSLGVLTHVMLTACSPFVGTSQQETFMNITLGQLDFPDDLFGHISLLAQDFIRSLLVLNPKKRLTSRQCLDHPWLKDESCHSQVPAETIAGAELEPTGVCNHGDISLDAGDVSRSETETIQEVPSKRHKCNGLPGKVRSLFLQNGDDSAKDCKSSPPCSVNSELRRGDVENGSGEIVKHTELDKENCPVSGSVADIIKTMESLKQREMPCTGISTDSVKQTC